MHATFKNRHRSSRGNNTSYEPLATWNLLNILAFKEKKNPSPSLRGSSQNLSANFRENSRNFHEKLQFFLHFLHFFCHFFDRLILRQ